MTAYRPSLIGRQIAREAFERLRAANDNDPQINPTRVPIEKKENVRWLDNLWQSIDSAVTLR